MTERTLNFSFLKLFNTIKGVFKPFKEDEVDPEWLEKSGTPQ